MKNLVFSWVLLLLLLGACLTPIFVGLGWRDSTHTMENIAMLSAQETWLRTFGYLDIEADPNAWLMPSRGGQPRINKPPMLVWLNMLAWADLDPAQAEPQQLLLRARLVSVAMGVLVIISVYWVGSVLGDWRLAVLAALACGTMWFLQRQARTASYDIHMTAWVSLAMASGLWAMRPFQSPPSATRFFCGWLLAAVSLWAGIMTKAIALIVFVLPMTLIVLLVPRRRRHNALALTVVVGLVVLLLLPWFAFAAGRVPDALQLWSSEFRAKRPEPQDWWYYVGLLGLLVPWTIWLVAALFQPFLRASGTERRRLLVPWFWFVSLLVLFSIPGAKQQRYILPIVPSAALLIGGLWRFHQHRADQGGLDQGVNLLRVPHWIALVAVSVLLPPFLLAQNWMVDRSWFGIEHHPVGPVPGLILLSGAPLLLLLAMLGSWWHAQWMPIRAALATGGWTIVFTTVLWSGYVRASTGVHPIRAEAERVSAIVGPHPLLHLGDPKLDNRINEEFLFYAKRIVPSQRIVWASSHESLEEEKKQLRMLQEWIQGRGDMVYLMARGTDQLNQILTDLGCERVTDFLQDKRLRNTLWVWKGGQDMNAG